MVKKIAAMSFLLLSFSACQKKGIIKKTNHRDLYELQESIARLIDIPDVPLRVTIQKIVPSQQNLDDVQIFCDVALLVWDDIKIYYEQGMERLGWNLQGRYEAGVESLMVFLKPSGSCCIILFRNNQQQLIITLLKK